MKKKLLLLVPILIFPLFFFHNCISYIYHLGKEQLKILNSREKISKVLHSNKIENKLKNKLKKVVEARKFAIKNLGLSPEGGFVYFVMLDREELGWHVTASYPLELKPYTWWFPIVGTVPYKGYFSKKMVIEEEKKLKTEGYDTRIRITAGYSTLGWFSDPIFSTQLKIEEDEVIALVFHEMAHGTVYFNGDALFNESYASFVEEKGTEYYYSIKNTMDAEEIIKKRKKVKQKNTIVIEEIKKTALELDKMYKSDISDSEKRKNKQLLFDQFKKSLSLKLKDFPEFSEEKLGEKKLNNEDFIGALRYSSGDAFFEKEFSKCKENFICFHRSMRKLQDLSIEERKELLEKNQ